METTNLPAAERYEQLELIGKGGMGRVFRGRDRVTNDIVAIKVLPPDALEQDPGLLKRLMREGETLRVLNHPNIVKMLDVIEEPDRYSLVLEYVGGGSVWDLLRRRGKLPIGQVLTIALGVADALTRAHQLKIIHRDIKPANILLAEDGTPRLTDFGLARMDTKGDLTQSGVMVGSVAYLSPESIRHAPPDTRMDLWAFGIVIYEMLAGRRPFAGEHTAAILASILMEPVPDLLEFRPDVPRGLHTLVMKMLEKDTNTRIPTARRVGAELEALIEDLATSDHISLGEFPTKGPSRFEDSDSPEFIQITPLAEYTPSLMANMAVSDIPNKTLLDLNDGDTVVVNTPSPAARTPSAIPLPHPTIETPAIPLQGGFKVGRMVLGLIGITLVMLLGILIITRMDIMAETESSDNRAAVSTDGGDTTTVNADNAGATDVAIAMPTIFTVDPVAEGELMVVVADLEPLGTERRNVDRFILEDLSETLEVGTPLIPIRIRDYPGMITSKEQAQAVADANEALMVVWGYYDDELVELNINVNYYGDNPQLDPMYLSEAGNVRVRLTDERNQSIAPQIILNTVLYYAFEGNAYDAAAGMVSFQELNVQGGEIEGETVGAYVQRHYQNLYGDTQAAIDALTRALQLGEGDNPMLYHLRAAAYDRLLAYDKAMEDVTTAWRMTDGEWAITYMNRANIEANQGNVQEAINQLTGMIELVPNDWLPYAIRGSFYYLMGDYESANADFTASIGLKPRASFPYILAMNIAVREGNVDELTELQATVLREFPDPTLANRILLTANNQPEFGGFYSQLLSAFGNLVIGQYNTALEEINQALEAQSDLAELYLFQGIAYCLVDDFASAEAAYTKGIELDPDLTILYLMRADMRNQLGNLTGAGQDFIAARRTTAWPNFEPLVNEALQNPESNALGCQSFFN